MLWTLRQYEGLRCVWRAPASAALLLLTRGIPVGAAVLVALVTVDNRALQAAIVSIITLLLESFARRIRNRVDWRVLVTGRLWSYEEPNPSTEVGVLLRADDDRRARHALRAARFSPQPYSLRIGAPPPDAPELNLKIAVHEPAAWIQSASHRDRGHRIAAVLGSAGLRARVNGIDVNAGDAPAEGESPALAGAA